MLLCLACYDECKEDGTTTTQLGHQPENFWTKTARIC